MNKLTKQQMVKLKKLLANVFELTAKILKKSTAP